jgi:uncharacterized protein (UPF0335 family)
MSNVSQGSAGTVEGRTNRVKNDIQSILGEVERLKNENNTKDQDIQNILGQMEGLKNDNMAKG